MKALQVLFCVAIFTLHASLFTSCSKEETEDGEWDNWQERNEAYLQNVVDWYRTGATPSFVNSGLGWKRLKVYSQDAAIEGDADDYVYAYVIEEGSGTASPAFTDSVRVIYQGRLIPSTTYPQGYVFDGTVYGDFSTSTSATSKLLVSGTVDGFSTALQHMHIGDRWRVYIPSALGYGTSGSGSSVPGHSLIVFDLQLIDFSHAGEVMPVWSSRRR